MPSSKISRDDSAAAANCSRVLGLNTSGILNNSNAGRVGNASLSLAGQSRFGDISLDPENPPGAKRKRVAALGAAAKPSPGRSTANAATPSKKSPGRRLLSLPGSPAASKLSGSAKKVVTPGRSTPGQRVNTPGGGDRFIPSRVAMDFERSKFRLLHSELSEADKCSMSPGKREFHRIMNENLTGEREKPSATATSSSSANPSSDPARTRILQYSARRPPDAPESHANGLKVLYSQGKAGGTASKKNTRHIPQVPERILDAPEIVNDYYLNLIDWSCGNLLAVALAGSVYLWNAGTGEIQQLMELDSPEDYVCSVRWIQGGASNCCLAVGDSSGAVSLWDAERLRRVRVMQGHADRVGCLAWNQFVLSSGCRSGKIHHSDVRVADHLVSVVEGHTQEVCGLAWSPDGKLLASGGNDNVLNVWEAERAECYSKSTPKFRLTQHQAAVKALAWCPWQPGLLASGGGTADRTVKIWNCNSGSLMNSIDTNSQVCSLLWSPEYRELVSAHGFANNEIIIWKYPSMLKTAELLGHTERVLHLSLSPDGGTLVSAGGDETLRLWKCFTPDPRRKRMAECNKVKKEQQGGIGAARGGIR